MASLLAPARPLMAQRNAHPCLSQFAEGFAVNCHIYWRRNASCFALWRFAGEGWLKKPNWAGNSGHNFLDNQIRAQLLLRPHIHLFVGRRWQWFSGVITATLDPDLHTVLQLASDAELFEISDILYGHSLLSPLLKSLTSGKLFRNTRQACLGGEYEGEGREALMECLESRFLFLAADAKGTLSGQRPTYRDVLLQVQKKLQVPCSRKLSTEDLEAEIFLHLLREYSSGNAEPAIQSSRRNHNRIYTDHVWSRESESSKWLGYVSAALKLGGKELFPVFLKGGSAFTISTLQNMVARRLGRQIILETAQYQAAKEVLKKGAQAVATRLDSHIALLVARQGLIGAASQYLVLRSMVMLIGPMMWGTFFADLVIRSVGTDYARIVRAIYAFAQIRLTRTYGSTYVGQVALK